MVVMSQTIQWTGDLQGAVDPEVAADAAATALPNGAFCTGPAWEEQAQVWLMAGGQPALVDAGPAVRAWRTEVEHAAVRLT